MPICSPCFGLSRLVDLSPAPSRAHPSLLLTTEDQGSVGAQFHGWTHVQTSPNFCCGIRPALMYRAQKVQVCFCWRICVFFWLGEIRRNCKVTQTVKGNSCFNHTVKLELYLAFDFECGKVLWVNVQDFMLVSKQLYVCNFSFD